jgi:Ca2+-binding EF-hand superfamily protein
MSQSASTHETPRSTTSRAELRREFKRVDRNVDGRIDFAEFKDLLEGLGAGMNQHVMQIGFHAVDADKDGLIDLQEFSDWWLTD